MNQHNEEPEQDSGACEIRLIKNDGGQVTEVEVVCKTPETRAEMATAIHDVGIFVKAQVKEDDKSL